MPINCGFFCRHDIANPHLGHYTELSDEDRRNGRFITLISTHVVPWCFRQVPIHDEIVEASGVPLGAIPFNPNGTNLAERQSAAVEQVARKDRNCPLWMAHQPDLGPQEHLGGLAMREMEQRRMEFEQRMEEQRRAFELELDRRNSETQRRNRRVDLALVFTGILLAAAQVLRAGPDALIVTWLRTLSGNAARQGQVPSIAATATPPAPPKTSG